MCYRNTNDPIDEPLKKFVYGVADYYLAWLAIQDFSEPGADAVMPLDPNAKRV